MPFNVQNGCSVFIFLVCMQMHYKMYNNIPTILLFLTLHGEFSLCISYKYICETAAGNSRVRQNEEERVDSFLSARRQCTIFNSCISTVFECERIKNRYKYACVCERIHLELLHACFMIIICAKKFRFTVDMVFFSFWNCGLCFCACICVWMWVLGARW